MGLSSDLVGLSFQTALAHVIHHVLLALKDDGSECGICRIIREHEEAISSTGDDPMENTARLLSKIEFEIVSEFDELMARRPD